MSLTAVVATDFHLGKLARFFPEDHLERQIVEIRKAYTYAVENGIKYLIIPGDVSDTPTMEERAFMAFVQLIIEFDEHVHTVYIPGNHDFQDIKKTSMDMLKFLTDEGLFTNFKLYMEPTQVKLDGIVVNFIPWSEHNQRAIKHRLPCLNFAHIERTGALMDNGRVNPKPVENEFKCKPEDYTISGHLHAYQEMKDKRTLWPGSIIQVKFNDLPGRGFVVINAKYKKSGALQVTHEFIQSHPNFILKRIVVETDKDWSTIENDPQGIYEVRLGDGVIQPRDIRTLCPNIFSIIGSKLTVEDAHKDVSSQKELPEFSLTTGLNSFLKQHGIKKKQRKLGLQLVERERNRLGL